MSLMDRLKAEIRLGGPISLAHYMNACLNDPQEGYYASRPRLGADGDFITAPMTSQMFGELIGLWSAEVWVRLGRPARVLWVEVGPGEGSLICDALRAARAAPAFLSAAELWLVETSGPLAQIQAERLAASPLRPRWIRSLQDLPLDAPVILVANEVLDCLPARQFVRTARGWAERMVGLDPTGALTFGLGGAAIEALLPQAEAGSVLEMSPAQAAFGSDVGERVARQGGAALLIDYGRDAPGFGDTLQALVGHRKVSPLESPGKADLTVHADFPAVLAAATARGAAVGGPLGQGEFLTRLGIHLRAEALARARPDRATTIARQLERLISPGQMGALFKAASISTPGLVCPGFEEA